MLFLWCYFISFCNDFFLISILFDLWFLLYLLQYLSLCFIWNSTRMLTFVLFTIFSKCNWLVTNVFICLFVQITVFSFTVHHPHLLHLAFQFYFYHSEHDQQLLSLSVLGALIMGFICGLSFILSFHHLPVFSLDFGEVISFAKILVEVISVLGTLIFLQRDYLFDWPAAWKSVMLSPTQLLSGCRLYASHSKWGGFWDFCIWSWLGPSSKSISDKNCQRCWASTFKTGWMKVEKHLLC